MLHAAQAWVFSSEKRFVTAAAVAHLHLHGGDETGEASKLKQTAKISSITLGMLGAGGMANYVARVRFAYNICGPNQ
jgi:hypothetical protein